MDVQIGARVGAILSADDEEVRFLGFGEYEGMFEPPVGPFGISWKEYEEIALDALGREGFEQRKADGTLRPKNPRIRLDGGSVVWGQECWWGDEQRVRDRLEGRRVVNVTVDDLGRDG